MFFARVVAALGLLVPTPVATAATEPVTISAASIVQVVCPAKGYITAGTAFRVGNGLILSVRHVTAGTNCGINGVPISVKYPGSSSLDFSMLRGDSGPFLKVDCGGFIKGHHYLSLGYARGLPFLTAVELVATGQTNQGESVLAGIFAIVPGMSGGPVLDMETGAVVGMNNMEDFEDGLSWSVPLSDTPICRKDIA